MKEILSTKNTWIKELKKYQKKKVRQTEGKYLLEGFHLIEEAQKNQQEISAVLVNQRGLQEWQAWLAEFPPEKLYFVSDAVMNSLSELPTPQGILAVMELTDNQTTDFSGRWLLLAEVQDPGNVGTMIRTADAAGFSGVILGEGTADIYSTKVLRSMQGSNFHLPIVEKPILEAIELFKSAGSPVYGTELNEAAVSMTEVKPLENAALIMGNEGQGLPQEILNQTDQNIYIPILGQAESLNVAVAAGILMYALALNN
ncbi:TrmH family RNA methyltransferase [Enterococcus sp. LJL90]